MLKRSAYWALVALGTTVGSVALDSSAAIADPNLPPAAFADRVERYERGRSGNWDVYFGEANASDERWDVYDASAALGRNNWTKEMTHKGDLGQWDRDIGVSLGRDGVLIVEFTDNYLSGNGKETSDLWIYEIGGIAEKTNVSISADGNKWYDLGIADRQDVGNDVGVGIDIDGLLMAHDELNSESLFSFVKLQDSGDNGYNDFKSGADIDAIAALSFVKKDPVDVPEPGLLLGLGLLGIHGLYRRKLDSSDG